MKNLSKIFLIIIVIAMVSFVVIKFFYYVGENSEENIANFPTNKLEIENNIFNENSENTIEKNEMENSKNKTDKNQAESSVYSIKNKDFYLYENPEGRYEEYRGIKLLEYDNSNDEYAEIYYVLYDYGTEPGLEYNIEITDENNKNLLINGKKNDSIIGGMISNIKIKKIDLNKKINIFIYEKYSDEKNNLSEATQIIDLQKDLEEKVIIDQSSNLKEGILGDIKYKYIDTGKIQVDKTSHAYSKNLVGESLSINVELQYGNRLLSEEHISFFYKKNVNNLDLDNTFEKLKLITKVMGQYGLSDYYGMYLANSGDILGEPVIITFEDMINLCNGLEIEKDGKKYKKDSFEIYAGLEMIKDEKVNIGNGITAIKYHFESEEFIERYIFIHNENIYEIRIPTNARISEEMLHFVENLETIK